MDTPLKRCRECGAEKSLLEFHKDKSRADGRATICKVCAIAKTREWYRNHRERDHENSRRWAKEHPSQRRVHKRRWLEKNPDYHKQWKKANPEYLYIAQLKRRARQKSLPAAFSPDDWQACLEYWNHCCAVCGRQMHDLFGERSLAADHWIPLNSPDCPGTVPSNIVPLCQGIDGCNNSKSDAEPLAWLTRRLGKRAARKKLVEIQAYFDSLVTA